MWQTHCIIFLPRKYSFHVPVVFFTKAFAICFPILFPIKNIWRALKNTDLECTGLGCDSNPSSIKLHWWRICLARFRNHCSKACVSQVPKNTHSFGGPLRGLRDSACRGDSHGCDLSQPKATKYNQQREKAPGTESREKPGTSFQEYSPRRVARSA